jgi:hypothetical protein
VRWAVSEACCEWSVSCRCATISGPIDGRSDMAVSPETAALLARLKAMDEAGRKK